MTEQPSTQAYQHPTASRPIGYRSEPRRRSPAWQWGCGLGLAGCLLAVMLGIFVLLATIMTTLGGLQGLEPAGEHVALIRIEGLLVAGQSGFSVLGGTATGSDEIVDQIEQAIEDDDVEAILLRINSPGGSAAGAQEIYAAINRAKEAEKVVVASMADVAASGGYYVAAPADVIFADPATITGSIGAIAVHQDMSGLFDKIGIEPEVIKSGKLKDMFQPTEPLTPEAREVVTALINQVFDQFVTAVANCRGMDKQAVLALADGRIYTGQQAAENGLIDHLGGLHEALMKAGERAGIEGKPEMKEYGAPSLLRWLLGGSTAQRRQPALTGGLLYDDVAARLACGGLYPEAGRDSDL